MRVRPAMTARRTAARAKETAGPAAAMARARRREVKTAGRALPIAASVVAMVCASRGAAKPVVPARRIAENAVVTDCARRTSARTAARARRIAASVAATACANQVEERRVRPVTTTVESAHLPQDAAMVHAMRAKIRLPARQIVRPQPAATGHAMQARTRPLARLIVRLRFELDSQIGESTSGAGLSLQCHYSKVVN